MAHPYLHPNRHTPLSILRSFVVIVISMILCSMLSAFTLQFNCLNTFYERLPEYPDAVLQSDSSSPLNHIGIGLASLEYYTSDDPETVHQWYQNFTRSLRDAERRKNPPPAWQGAIDLFPVADDPGTAIHLTAVCRVARLESGDVSFR